MRRTWRLASMLALGASMLLVGPVMAGGWATATVTDPPDGPVAGEVTTIGVELKQHDTTPISWETLFFMGTEQSSGTTVFATARPEGPTGHYVIDVTFPREGQWEWRLQTLELVLEAGAYPTIAVAPGLPLAAQPTAAPPAVATQGIDPVLVIGAVIVAFLLGTIGGTMLRRPTAPKPVAREVPAIAR